MNHLTPETQERIKEIKKVFTEVLRETYPSGLVNVSIIPDKDAYKITLWPKGEAITLWSKDEPDKTIGSFDIDVVDWLTAADKRAWAKDVIKGCLL